jgi:hypothetical protein
VFSSSDYQSAHDRMDCARGREITIRVNNGTGFDSYASRAVFGQLTERDFLDGSSLKQGDVRLIVSSTNWPDAVPTLLAEKDRVDFDGQSYAVVSCDPYSRMIGEHRVATELVVRG